MQVLQRFFSAALVWLGLASPAWATDLAIVGAKVYTAPDAAPIERGTVLARNGRITAVGPAARVTVPRPVR
jgi:imidazolonepropionase-like amidohydrolase